MPSQGKKKSSHLHVPICSLLLGPVFVGDTFVEMAGYIKQNKWEVILSCAEFIAKNSVILDRNNVK
jgi:hypothetical protein